MLHLLLLLSQEVPTEDVTYGTRFPVKAMGPHLHLWHEACVRYIRYTAY
jgi:hypothetical protein